MDNNDIIDDHLIHDPHQGIGKLQSIIRVSGVLAIIGALLGVMGIFQQLFSVGQQMFRVMSSSFDRYLAYDVSSMLIGMIMIVLETALTLFLFKFGLVAINAGKKKLGQQQWDTLFKDLRNILMIVVGYVVVSLFSYITNILISFLLM